MKCSRVHKWHQAITWTDIDLSPVRSSDIRLRAISQEITEPSVIKINLQITCIKFSFKSPREQQVNIQLISPSTNQNLSHRSLTWEQDLESSEAAFLYPKTPPKIKCTRMDIPVILKQYTLMIDTNTICTENVLSCFLIRISLIISQIDSSICLVPSDINFKSLL